MDNFAKGLHYVYDHSNNTFIPYEQTISPAGTFKGHGESNRPDKKARPAPIDTSLAPSDSRIGSDYELVADEFSSPLSAEFDEGENLPHIPRPRNAFMIFRSEFILSEKISPTVEHDHRHISRIIGYYWNRLTEEEKNVWRLKADMEKMEHVKKYPNYRFNPTPRSKKTVKRKTKRSGEADKLRCKKVAELIFEGKEGQELENALKEIEQPKPQVQSPGTFDSGPFHDSQEGYESMYKGSMLPSPESFPDFDGQYPHSSSYQIHSQFQGTGNQSYPDAGLSIPQCSPPGQVMHQAPSFLVYEHQASPNSYQYNATNGAHYHVQIQSPSYHFQQEQLEFDPLIVGNRGYTCPDSAPHYTFLAPSLPPTLTPSRRTYNYPSHSISGHQYNS